MKKTDKRARQKAAKARQKTARTTPKTQRELAALLGISPALVSWHLKHSESPPPLNDPEAWLDFLAVTGREGSLPEDLRAEIGGARKRLIEAQAERLERQNRVVAGDLVSKSEVQHGLQVALAAYFAGLEKKFLDELPPVLAGLDERSIRQHCEKAIEEFKAMLREAFYSLGGVGQADRKAEERGHAAIAAVDPAVVAGTSVLDRQLFEDFRRQRLAEQSATRLEWCRKRVAADQPVYNATPQEMASVPGLRNHD